MPIEIVRAVRVEQQGQRKIWRVGKCYCGREVILAEPVNSCWCGRDFNRAGVKLPEREPWHIVRPKY